MDENEKLKRALYFVKELRDRLVEMQWSNEGGTEVSSWGVCPMCGAADWRGHKANCGLHKQIQEVEEFLATTSSAAEQR